MASPQYLYSYIAASNPGLSVGLCEKYGYDVPPVRNFVELGGLLEQLKDREGEAAFRDIMDLHPEKNLILEMYAPEVPAKALAGADGTMQKKGCGCQECQESHHHYNKNNFSHADGGQQTLHPITPTQTGLLILGSAFLIAFAIISKK